MAIQQKKTFLTRGLASREVAKRLKENGPNELKKEKRFSSLKIFLDQFKSPLVYILLLAGVVTLFLRETADSIIIFAAVFLNTALGFYQEGKAQKALTTLRSFLVAKTEVIRNGKRQIVNASELVSGDLVILTIGARVPADGVLIEAIDFSVNEAILTGESASVTKIALALAKIAQSDKANQVFMGTNVSTGIGKMVVTQTGMATEMGKIGAAVSEIKEEKTPLQLQLGSLARILAIVVGVASVLIFLIGLWRNKDPVEMFTTSVAVAVAAIPEGLLVTLTVILSLGMQRILKRKALVRKLIAAETLGSVSVICADKTGTLTEGKMRVTKVEASDLGIMKLAAALCNDLRDPLEIAMWAWLKEAKEDPQQLFDQSPRLDERPFSPDTKYIATLNQVQEKGKEKRLLFFSGAPEVILKRCQMTEAARQKMKQQFNEYGQQSLRIVGFAYKTVAVTKDKIQDNDLKEFTWLGILAYEDPIRPEVKEVFKQVQKAGITIKVITGDYLTTAIGVMAKIGFALKSEQAIEGKDLDGLSEDALEKKIKEAVLFARTDPTQKLKIVEALKKQGEVVAMMGDGVNDAPALAKADIGIVVGEASDVAKETADMILLDSRFETVFRAIEEGRVIFENLKKVVLYLLSDSFTEVILIGGALLLGLPLPVTAAQILWINLVEDTLPALALAFEPEEREIMAEPPRARGAGIIDLEMKTLIFIIGISTDLILLTLVFFLDKGLFHLHHLRTVVFAALAIDSLFYAFSCRSLRKTVFQTGIWANKFLVGAVALGFLSLLLAIYFPPFQVLLKTHPLDWQEWLLVLVLGILEMFMIELTKWVFIVNKKKSDKTRKTTN